ncbi:MAG: flagellin [Rhodobacteraceae bacterium]|nr:flagellin [Paracoccaceae bacterium]
MALAIATNTGALMAAASASSVNKDMETSMERLSTGKRINSANDDAAGVAIASRLSSEIRGTNQAIRNAMDAQGLIDTAEGAHKEVENILQRMRELAVQAANDTNDSTDRSNLSAEMTQLTTEITRIATTSSWAGQALLNGDASTATPATATTQEATFNFQIGAGSKDQEQISVDVKAMTAEALGVAGSGTVATITNVASSLSGGTSTVSSMSVSTAGVVTFNSGSSTAIAAGSTYSFTVEGVDISITVDATDSYADTAAGVAKQMGDAIVAADITGLNVAVNESAGTVTLTNGGSLSLTNATNARSAVNNIDSAIETLNTQRANLGAVSNRLDNTVSNLTNAVINLEAGKGRIEDADFAAESTSLAKSQILQQASTAMLAQANASKQNVLSLLQG